MINPDKYIRAYFFTQLNNIVVDTHTVTIHDMIMPQNSDKYILMTNQSSVERYDSKCDIISYDCSLTLDIVTIYEGNNGSRLLADNIKERVINETQNINISNFETSDIRIGYPSDIITKTNTQTIFRKLINYEFKLNQL